MNDVYGIGDSIMLSASPFFTSLGCNINIDAEVGRQFAECIPILTALPLAPSKLVIHLGTNGYIHQDDMDWVIKFMRGNTVWFTTIYVDRLWQKPNNKIIRDAIKSNLNVRIVPWRYHAIRHPEWFGDDGYHPNATGQRAYAKLTCNKVEL